MEKPVEFGIVGGGWRAEFYLRIARALPERFHVDGMLVRDPAKGAALEAAWGVRTFRTMDELLKSSKAAFQLVSVHPDAAAPLSIELAARKIPVLLETPPARSADALNAFYQTLGASARIQVAEQYALQPIHAARLNLIKSGRLGDVSQAQVSVAHDYHGMSLIRRFLGINFEDAVIKGISFKSPLVEGAGRGGPPKQEKIIESSQSIATLDFGGKLGVYDFTGNQYFAWIRSPRVLIRGGKGEISNDKISWLADFKTPLQSNFARQEAGQDGNLEGFYLKGILAGGEWAYVNPFAPGRLCDDEIAIASCLEGMAAYIDGGPAFYSLAEACQDTYLGLMTAEAIRTEKTVKTERQSWSVA
ncbi:MAG: Gfo/Idh/MocA family oxidoreductase [Victivallaceae bacterium]